MMDLDPAVLIPALLFTVVALYFASSLLNKKPSGAASSAGNKKPKVGYGDDVPPSRALGQPRTESPAPEVREKVRPGSSAQDPVLQLRTRFFCSLVRHVLL